MAQLINSLFEIPVALDELFQQELSQPDNFRNVSPCLCHSGKKDFTKKTFTEQMSHVKYLKIHQIRADRNT